MKGDSFEQKRMIQLSRELDRQRDRNNKLVNETHELAEEIKLKEKNIQSLNNQVNEIRISSQKNVTIIQQLNNSLKLMELEKDGFQDKYENVSLQNVRQRQKIEELKQEMLKYENKVKDILFAKQKQINEKDKENFKLRQDNIETEKLYLKQRQELQKYNEKYFKTLTKLKADLDAYRKDLDNLRFYFEKAMKLQNNKTVEIFTQTSNQIKRIQDEIIKQRILKDEIKQLKVRLEEVVTENSQKIIQLYRYKNFV